MLSIVVPCFNEEETVDIFYGKVSKLLPEFCPDYEIIFVDDGSKDLTLDKIKQICEKDDKAKYISFSRNFGKEAAILAGFEKSKGDLVTLLDVDLQDPVELLPKMYKCINEEDYDVAAARRISRDGEPFVRSWFSDMFYLFMQKGLKLNIKSGVRDYRLMKREVLNSVLSLREKTRFSKALFPWVGYKTKYFEFKNIKRVAGVTKYSFIGLCRYALDGIFAFSNAPLTLMSFGSVVFCLIAFAAAFGLLISQELSWNVLIAVLILIFLGVQMVFFAILAQYIAKIYTETKNRPHYFIREQSKD